LFEFLRDWDELEGEIGENEIVKKSVKIKTNFR
jgi:hypothetical protein